MKLRNKKTGEIRELPDGFFCGDNLKKICEEWEDYEEPEGWWFIDSTYEPHATNSTLRNLEADKQIGNYFLTKEGAEKALKKLKAWKRLKDKRFSLDAVVDPFFCLDIFMSDEPYEVIKDDLKIVFGND